MERIWGEACFGLNDYQAAIPLWKDTVKVSPTHHNYFINWY